MRRRPVEVYGRQSVHCGTRSHSTTSFASQRPSRPLKYAKWSSYIVLSCTGIVVWDYTWNASALIRTWRTLWTCTAVALDYKYNFTAEKGDSIPELHARVADRMYNLFTGNGGLYIKFGQAIAANAAFLPKPVQEKFATLFDDAPQVPYKDLEAVFISEFGRPPDGPDGVFEYFDKTAVASASIAQVHKALLRPTPGDTREHWVAVKIQKPDVGIQTGWDLAAFKAVMWMFERSFELPVYFAVDYIASHIKQELDFIREASNSKRTAQLVESEPMFSDRVYIPKIYDEFSTLRVMTSEWIDAVRFSDPEGVKTMLGPSGSKALMQTMVELFSAQMFSWGFVHCDPHPGNILVRPHPTRPRQPQLVLLDHGLYVEVSQKMRQDWARVFKAMLSGDRVAVEAVTDSWGFGMGMGDMFASFALLKPVRLSGPGRNSGFAAMMPPEGLSNYEKGVHMKAALKNFLIDTDKMPKVLPFMIRNMRMVQGNNQALGVPVNRLRINGEWASRSLTMQSGLPLLSRLREYWFHFTFQVVMFSIDIAFWWNRARQMLGKVVGFRTPSFEDEIETAMRKAAQSALGVELTEAAFEG
ncbi:ABC1-domain-containing protein [Fistulina hepatica ATCC 64428]|uniref:ABC1-domain-containing protein n=1 Tax=Fistulina hepatica ATCC 64428 TaxID=1128425 RepID=A0A0D7A464_9AGAR|nr:ABC1-domain-containing protein [Fistulina hepatica ATCC 64428]